MADPRRSTETAPRLARQFRLARLIPLAAIVVLTGLALATGWDSKLSFETLVKHRAALTTFVDGHQIEAIATFIGIYIVAVALSLPGALFLTIAGGILFGTVVGGLATVIGATIGATVIFLIARSSVGEYLARRDSPLMQKIASGFREDAFGYLLFLRLVPIFPFWLVNLAPALLGVPLSPFVISTIFGIIPATFAFASFGAGLDSVIAAQETAYQDCLAVGRSGCSFEFDAKTAVTPQLLLALIALGVLALIPVAVKHWRARLQTP